MFLFGIVIHVFFLLSIFDIYFKSPIVKDVVHYKPEHKPLADRLVLFVVDGLRAESFVNYTTMPYLRSIANSHGRWGISRTRVPTESRPGHIAVISGFYEDPSAVAKGWKDNPVDFDSVFNQTAYTWCWGTYDIVNIFTKGKTDDHIFSKTFDPYNDAFSSDKNTTLLDSWVFDNVTEFFSSATKYVNIAEKLNKNKIGFFLHLLGTDTSGHTDKPKSDMFLTTIKYVDERIKVIEKVFRDFYGDDGKTTFLVTSDHGMTDWGSHGAGDDHETETPYVIWGAGVKQLAGDKTDPSTKGMSLERRLDVEQADLAPLMSTILSIPVPVNSIGKLVPDILNMTLENKAKALYSNARQLASQYDKKRSDIEANILKIFHFPFLPFTKDKYKEVFEITEHLLQEKEYEKLVLLCDKIMSLSLSGLDYYHNYYQRPLLFLVTLSFVGWIMCLLRLLAEQNVNEQTQASGINKYNLIRGYKKNNLSVNVLFSVLFALAFIFVFAQSLPMTYYVYFLKPIILWWFAMSNEKLCKDTFLQLRNRGLYTVSIEIICYTLGSLALGLSFTYRWMLSVPLLGMALWPFFSKKKRQLSEVNLMTWSTTCAALSIFTFLPVVGKEVYIDLVIIAGIIQLIPLPVYIVMALLPLYKTKMEHKREIVLSAIQILLRIIALHNVYVQSNSFDERTSVSSIYQVIAWVIAVLSLVLPVLHSKRLVCRLVAINASILNLYLLLSVCHEGLFVVALMCNTSIWVFIEFKLLGKMAHKQVMELMFHERDQTNTSKSLASVERCISSEDFRRAFFFMTYIIVAFFGTGNIASLNSFEVRWVICFLTSYKPFVITALILLKTVAPFLVVACAFRAVQLLTKAPIGYLNIIVLIYSNIMGIQLLFFVKNTGSWMEIGTSISQYVIVQVITIFIVLINKIAKDLTEISVFTIKSRKKYL